MKRIIGCFVSLCIIYIIMNQFYNEKNISNEFGQNDIRYVVQLSKSMKMIYSLIFWAGVILTLFFGIIKLKWGGGVTAGHMWFALILMLIGIIIIAVVSKWKVQVDGDQITKNSFGHAKKEIRITEIDEIEEGTEGEITLYVHGKKFITVEEGMQNYDRFKNTLKRYGK